MIAQQSAAVGETEVAPKVSIVLPVYNSESELSAALLELEKQSYRDREIVIVDDGSTDGTWALANSLWGGRRDVTLVRTDHRGASHARNVGVENARGEIIFFSEADCVYDEAYLQRAVDSLDSHPEAGAVCLTGAPLITRSTLATQSIDIENKMQHALLNKGKIRPFYAWVYRRDAFVKLGGFDERLFQGEDKDLFVRLEKAKYGVAWVRGVNWRHRRDQTTFQLARKWFTRGRSRVLYSIKHRRLSDIVRTMAPFWATVLGVALLVVSPLIGGLIILLVALAFVAHSLRVMSISWPLVQKKRTFLGYPFFVVARNFSMAMGYSVGLFMILVRKTEGRKVTWDNI
jgi:glycosyltransferase involved in cell wall biosynthesis